MAGASIQWLRDGLGLIKSAQEVDLEAAKVHDNGGVYLVPAFYRSWCSPLESKSSRYFTRYVSRDNKKSYLPRNFRRNRLPSS